MSTQRHPTRTVPVSARSNGLALLLGVGSYIALIPVALALACVAAFGV